MSLAPYPIIMGHQPQTVSCWHLLLKTRKAPSTPKAQHKTVELHSGSIIAHVRGAQLPIKNPKYLQVVYCVFLAAKHRKPVRKHLHQRNLCTSDDTPLWVLLRTTSGRPKTGCATDSCNPTSLHRLSVRFCGIQSCNNYSCRDVNTPNDIKLT